MNDVSQRDFLDRRQLVSALRSFRRGDFSVRLPEDLSGTDGEIARLFNEVVMLEEQMTEIGVRVEYLPYTTHTSSTLLRETLERLASAL